MGRRPGELLLLLIDSADIRTTCAQLIRLPVAYPRHLGFDFSVQKTELRKHGIILDFSVRRDVLVQYMSC